MLRFHKRKQLISEYIENVRADRLDEWSMDDLGKMVKKYEELLIPIFESQEEIKIGDKFNKRLDKGKTAECQIVDIVKKVSVHTGKTFGTEYWAISLSDKYTTSGMFEVSKTSILRSRLNGV